MNTKHTPGPWELFEVPGYCNLRVKGYGVICDFLVDGPNEKMDAEAKANARLIAAAPELLEAAKAIWGHLESGALVRDTSNDHKSDWAIKQIPLVRDLQALEAAIRKAEGQD